MTEEIKYHNFGLQLSPSDEELVSDAQNGDNSAFEKLVLRYESRIYNLVLHMTGDQSLTRDILQETFLSSFRNLKKFKGNSKFSTWLYKIAVNYVLIHRRKKKILISLDDYKPGSEDEHPHQIADWADSPAATLDNSELKTKLNNAIETLPEEYKSVLILSDVEGLSNKEIQGVLKLSLPAIKSRLHRARLILREKLSEYFISDVKNKILEQKTPLSLLPPGKPQQENEG